MDINLLPQSYRTQSSRLPVYLGGGLLALALLFGAVDVWNAVQITGLSHQRQTDKTAYAEAMKQDAALRTKMHSTSSAQATPGHSVNLQMIVSDLMKAAGNVVLHHIIFKQPDTISGTGTAASLDALASYEAKLSGNKAISSVWVTDVTKVAGGKYSFDMTVQASNGGAS
ncbi:hypothetical protein [Alicyclobacillus sp. SO9]|uniref:hypothetical protein n=1 Tax=Alicyclobacillus sp. SO9 TaxID=2665646 RepID=UPI0018E8F496|nr:hypothetical protein [Alicyclobacillus sp. SO9]QQE77547.1 hypothetical protein GI364_16590 [Alicyclobacillus sp. SO9]